jgi:proline racemase
MCGHGVLALVTALVETGAVPTNAPLTLLTLDTPAGVVRAAAHVGPDGKVAKVSFRNVPSFLLQRDLALDVPGLGPLVLDVAFGGAFYAILPAERIQLRVEMEKKSALLAAAAARGKTLEHHLISTGVATRPRWARRRGPSWRGCASFDRPTSWTCRSTRPFAGERGDCGRVGPGRDRPSIPANAKDIEQSLTISLGGGTSCSPQTFSTE